MNNKLIALFGFVITTLLSCQQNNYYKKEIPESAKKELANNLLNGVAYYYQGTVAEQLLVEEALSIDSTNADIWRELGTAQVKRGFASKMQYFYGKAVNHNPKIWQGWRGYLYLYFYRDYQRAINDFNAVDSILGLVGNSQGQDHDYMRGIAFYGLKNYDEALKYFDAYINQTIAKQGLDWVDVYAILYRGLIHKKMGNNETAIKDFKMCLEVYPNLANAQFHLAEVYFNQNKTALAKYNLSLARENFMKGYFHQRPYIEVLDQIYIGDIEEMEARF